MGVGMENLGFLGILKLTTELILRNLKHFLCVALVLALPNALLLLPVFPSSSSAAAALAHAISQLSSLYAARHGHASLPDQDATPPPPIPFARLLVTLFFSLFIYLITQPFVTFSVSRACLLQSISLRGSLFAVPRSAKNLILTVLSMAGILLGLWVAMVLVMVAVATALFALGVDPAIFVVIWILVVVGGGVYLAIAWSLADTVAVMEEKKGWEAMERSRYLLDGRKGVALGLAVLFGGCLMFFPIAVSEGASVYWRWSCAVWSLGLQAMVTLWSMAAMVVLYLCCKARLNESLDTLVALSSQFGPCSPKYMSIESIPL